MKDKEVYFLLYASCIPVSGYKQTVICDTNNEVAKILPNDLFNLVAKSKDTDVETFKKIYHGEYDEIIDNLFNHLITENIGFYTNNPQCFPKMSLLWETPQLLTNIVLVIKKDSVLENSIFNQIEESGCETIQIRFLFNFEIYDIEKILQNFHKSRLRSIELILLYNPVYKLKEYHKILQLEPRITSVFVYSSPFNKTIINKRLQNFLVFSTNNISENDCGVIRQYYFRINTLLFTESQNHNTCLNRKLCIDSDGNIKNCISMNRNFGNIKGTTLLEAIEKEGFKDLWFITKDQIDICKDCEFRYMCTDCRSFIKDTDNIYSQPAKCTYNPYIAKWAEEEGYVPVEECGSYNKETGFVPDIEKITAINEKNNQQQVTD